MSCGAQLVKRAERISQSLPTLVVAVHTALMSCGNCGDHETRLIERPSGLCVDLAGAGF